MGYYSSLMQCHGTVLESLESPVVGDAMVGEWLAAME